MTRRRTAQGQRLARWVAAALVLSVPSASVLPAAAWAASAASKEAAVVAKQALQYYQSGKWAIAAELYRRAYRIDPTRPEYLFGVGRAEQRAGNFKEALLAYETLLTILPEGEAFRAKVESAVAETKAEQAKQAAEQDARAAADAAARAAADAKAKADAEAQAKAEAAARAKADKDRADADKDRAAAEAKAAEKTAGPTDGAKKAGPEVTLTDPRKAPAPAAEPNWLGWGLVAGGGAMAFTGLGLGIGVLSDGSDWASLMAKKDQTGQIVGTDYQTAAKMAEDLNQRGALALGVGLVGLAAAGAGTWLLLRKTDRVVIMPTTSGALLHARF